MHWMVRRPGICDHHDQCSVRFWREKAEKRCEIYDFFWNRRSDDPKCDLLYARYIGATTRTVFANGGALLHAVASDLILPGRRDRAWNLGISGVYDDGDRAKTSFANYFHELIPQLSYRKITAIVCLFSFAVSNVGLSYLIMVSQPVLMMIYPDLIVLIVLSFGQKWIGQRKMVYVFSMIAAFCIACINAMDSVGVSLGILTTWGQKLPLYHLHLGGSFRRQGEHCLGCFRSGRNKIQKIKRRKLYSTMEIKLLAVDMDETVVNSRHQMTEKTRMALETCHSERNPGCSRYREMPGRTPVKNPDRSMGSIISSHLMVRKSVMILKRTGSFTAG